MRVSLHGSCLVIGRSRLQNPIILRLVFYSWQVLASFVYSARILEEFHLIRLLPCILMIHIRRISEQRYLFKFRDIIILSLPLRDREVATNFTIRFITHNNAYCFISRTHHLDLLSRLLASYSATCFSGTVGTRFLA